MGNQHNRMRDPPTFLIPLIDATSIIVTNHKTPHTGVSPAHTLLELTLYPSHMVRVLHKSVETPIQPTTSLDPTNTILTMTLMLFTFMMVGAPITMTTTMVTNNYI